MAIAHFIFVSPKIEKTIDQKYKSWPESYFLLPDKFLPFSSSEGLGAVACDQGQEQHQSPGLVGHHTASAVGTSH